MKAKIISLGLAGVLLLVASPAHAAYSSIQHNLFDTQPDTTFNPVNGAFTISATNAGLLTLTDTSALTGAISNIQIDLVTYFNTVLPSGEAKFLGGSLSLSFDYDPPGAPPVDSFNISGPINGMFFSIKQLGPNSKIDGLGRWIATNVDLPSQNGVDAGIWPVAAPPNNFSSIDSLTIAFAQDLTAFDWTTPLTGRVESLYSLYPDGRAVPEPTTLALLVCASVGLLRRRAPHLAVG
ncbi:MAG: PEP-CTERM sorting domain-containing protein [Phycisphaerales bacterium]|nr:PEP-CTERM sorting domain-containing protein [Phycisphaerales bacterium]